MRREWIPMRGRCLAGFFLVACTTALAAPPPAQQADRLVLVTVASLRSDRLGWASTRGITPHLDGLASEGAFFARARTPVPATVPALVSVLTGRGPRAHGVLRSSDSGMDLPTLQGILEARGLTTLAAVASPELAEVPLLRTGFTRFLTDSRPPAPVLARRAADLIGSLAPDEPFFLWVHFNDCTAPYRPPVKDLLELAAAGRHTAWRFPIRLGTDAASRDALPPDATNGPLRSAAFFLDSYDATVRQVDRGIGVLWDTLAGAHRDRTLLVVASLHGEALGEHGYWFSHGRTLHEEELQVPLLFRGPGVESYLQVEQPVSLLDLAPTVLSILGAERQSSDGRDLSPWFRGRSNLPVRYHYSALVVPPYGRAVLALDRFKLIFSPPRPPMIDGPAWWPTSARRELYDVRNDPLEGHPIEQLRVGVANELQIWLEDRFPPIPGTPPAEDTSRRR